MIWRLAILVLLACNNVLAETEECDITCLDNTTCVKGEADFSKHPRPDNQPLDIHTPTISDGGWHCDCPDGKTGLHCGRTYIGCENKEHKCYHGGKCIPGVADRFGNDQEFCDCAEAVDRHGIKHVGKYCEIPVPEPCNDDKSVFCVNNGWCKEDYQDHHHRPCNCDDKHSGPHCEYKKGQVPDCDLKCENGGHCRLGIKSYRVAEFTYENFWKNATQNFTYCECEPGFFGLKCEVTSDKCGDHHCFNGGECISNKKGDKHCDCTKANAGGSKFGGRFCQYEASFFCNETTDGQTFCVNNGKCNEEGGHKACECPQGFHGPICEYADSEDYGDYEECNLSCENGGKCRKGIKDVSFLDKFGLGPVVSNLANQTHNGSFEHCVCPDGFVGHTCDIEVKTCGDKSHICLYGSKCVKDGDGHKCDCDSAFTGLEKFAGDHCQHKATEFCTSSGQLGIGKDNDSFCTNNGVCINPKDGGHNGCECPKGYTGVHCEKSSVAASTNIGSSSTSGESKSTNRSAAIVLSLLAVALVAVVVAFAVVYRRRRTAIDHTVDKTFEDTRPQEQPVALDMGPQHDLDGNQLENVEII